MKLTCALLFSAAMGMSAVGNAQTLRVNIQANNVATSQILSEIEKQTDYLFVYNKKEVDLNRRATVHAVNQTTAEVLSNLFEGTDIVYAIEGENIMLMKRTDAEKLHATEGTQQARIITGIVTDKDGIPVIGANVVVKGTTNGTITDMDGKFSLEVPEGATLEISYIGYVTQTIRLGDKRNLNVTMHEDSQALDELVVVGFGTQKKINVTGAVSMVDSEVLESRPVQNVGQALQGVIPGLNLSVNKTGGELNNALDIDVRGVGTIGEGSNASPLILIDGVEGDMNSINPNDIESISVLKDAASASIYGSRAAFGVILITTKSGKAGRTTVNYSGNVRFTSPAALPNMMDSYSFAQYFNRAAANEGMAPVFDENTLQRILDYQAGKITSGSASDSGRFHKSL